MKTDPCANSVDPDETARNAVSSGSTPFAILFFVVYFLTEFPFSIIGHVQIQGWKSLLQKLMGESLICLLASIQSFCFPLNYLYLLNCFSLEVGLVNPFMLSGLFYLNSSDRSISIRKVSVNFLS